MIAYLATKPTDGNLVELIIAIVLLVVATLVAGWEKNLWRMLTSTALFFLVLAFAVR